MFPVWLKLSAVPLFKHEAFRNQSEKRIKCNLRDEIQTENSQMIKIMMSSSRWSLCGVGWTSNTESKGGVASSFDQTAARRNLVTTNYETK